MCLEWPDLIRLAVERITQIANDAIDSRGEFHCVLSGGETPREIYRQLRDIEMNWPVWQFWFGDERCLAEGDSGRNSTMVERALLNHLPISDEQIWRIPGELGAERAAREYDAMVTAAPVFDLVMLGLGEDGHVASLFPGNDLGDTASSPDVMAVFNAPKLPRQRVSLTINRINRSRRILFVVAGTGKQRAMQALRRKQDIPASAIRDHPETTELLFSERCR